MIIPTPTRPQNPTTARAVRSCWSALGLLLTAALVTGCTSTPDKDGTPTAALETSAALPTGTTGAVHFDDGFVQIGDGAKTVDLFVDPMCPFCKLFEETSGTALFADASAGKATLRVHPVAILNRLSQGTNYSTRASAVVAAVAAEHPDHAQTFLQELYQRQPMENTPGLTDAQLLHIAATVGVEVRPSEQLLDQYRRWVDQHTSAALTGPLTATNDIPAISQVPTVVVNGAVFPGNSDDATAFTRFYRTH